VFAFYCLRPIRIPENPQFFSKDVTVIIPSLEGDGPELFDTIQSILATEPYEIILVTVDAQLPRAQLMIKRMGTSRVRAMSVPHPNKRWQMVRAIPEVHTDITIFADDDVTWPLTLLPWILAPFEDERYGGVGTNQRLRRATAPSIQQRAHGFLGALYLERRNFDCGSCMYMDGGLPCLSGRTVAYRTKILKDKSFIYEFTHELWMSKYQLHADDDNFLTRWMYSRGWKIWYQYHKEAEVLTTLEDNPKFWRQCLRWVRSNWRSNLTSMFREKIWRSVHSWFKSQPNVYFLFVRGAGFSRGARTRFSRRPLPIGRSSGTVYLSTCIAGLQYRGVTSRENWGLSYSPYGYFSSANLSKRSATTSDNPSTSSCYRSRLHLATCMASSSSMVYYL